MYTELEKKIIAALEDLPLCSHPFKVIAEKLEIDEETLLAKIREFEGKGIMRRFGAVLRHRNAGIVANAMVVWKVEEERTSEVGKKMASFPQVSHCYQRVTYPDWQYNLYTMIHANTKEECERIAADIADKVGVDDYRLLYSTRELKKTSMKYFLE